MSKFNAIVKLAAVALTVGPGQRAEAEVGIYPFASSANYCPDGLRPVSIDGTICCGTPNQSITYQSAMAHPAPSRERQVAPLPRRAPCPVGTKGCTFD